MLGGGEGLFAQNLKAHTMIDLVVTTKYYGHKNKTLCSISYLTVGFVHLSFVLRIAEYSILPVFLEYTLRALPKFAVQAPFDRSKNLGNNLP